MATPREVLALCREKSVRAVDLWFTDLAGHWQRITVPSEQLDEETFEQGLAGESIHLGTPTAGAEGMVLFVPQPDTAFLDPTSSATTLGLICTVAEPITGEECRWDPRNVAARAVNHANVAGAATEIDVGWAIDYYLFRSARGTNKRAVGGREDAAIAPAADLLPADFEAVTDGLAEGVGTPLADSNTFRSQIAQWMSSSRIPLSAQHSFGKTVGQGHIELHPRPLVRSADGLMLCKYLARQLARSQGLLATFMPHPMWGGPSSRLAMHVAFRDHDRPVFAGSSYAGLSDLALYAVGGLLRHTSSLMAFTNPSTNSYRAFISDPPTQGYSQRPAAMVHLPNYQANPAAKRIVYRIPDATANPYLALSAVVMAMVDGIQNKISPGASIEQIEAGEADLSQKRACLLPRDLHAAIDALKSDHEYLTRGEVFSPELLEAWIKHKHATDIGVLRSRPHPHEYALYFDC